MLGHRLDGMKHSEQLGWVGRRETADARDEGAADQPQQPAGERVAGNRAEVAGAPSCLLSNRGAEMGEVSRGLLGSSGVLHHSLPFGLCP